MQIIIDKEFQSLIPPLTAEEYEGLEKSILADGCRDALVLWGDTLVDGHNRYEICTSHNVPFQTVQKDFDDRDDAKLWMMRNQLARRNLQPIQRIDIVRKCKDAVKAKAAERLSPGTNQHTERSQENFPETSKGQARDELGAMAGVSGKTFEHGEVVLNEAPEAVVEAVKQGDMSIDAAYQVTKMDAEQQKDVADSIKSGVKPKDAVKGAKRKAKKKEMREAQQAIAAQTVDSPDRPILHVGNGIGYVPEHPYDMLLTDPPYSTDVDNIDDFARSWLPNALAHVKDTGFAYVFIGAYPNELRAYLNIDPPAHLELTQVLIWSYRNTLGITPKDRYDQSYQACLFYRGKNAPALNCPLTSEKWAVMEVNAPGGITEKSTGDMRYHSWQKPMEIAERFVRHATEPGMTVFDPFACTGTFLLAAAKLGRKAYGFEINPDNAALAFERGCADG